MSIIETAARSLTETRGADGRLPWGDTTPPTNASLAIPVAGVGMSDDVALSIATVSACVALLADTVSSTPLLVMRRTKDRSKKIIDPQPQVVANPWPEGTVQDWLTQVMVSLTLRGNFFGQIVGRDPDGYPLTIMPIHPDAVVARRNRDGLREYRFWGRLMPTADVFHIPGPMLLPGSFVGLNPVDFQRQSWGGAAAAQRYSGQFFANGANPGGYLSTEEELDDDETLKWAQQWRASHGGIGAAHLPAVLSGGAKWNTVSLTNEASQFLQTRAFQREEIISWFRIPASRMGISGESKGPLPFEETEMLYMADAVNPYFSRIASHLSLPRITPPSRVVVFDPSGRIRGNTLQRMQAGQISANSGLETIDEIRARNDQEPLPNNMGRVVARPYNMAYFDVDTGEVVNEPPAQTNPPNPGGLGGGGGNPDNAPSETTPDTP